MTADIIKLMVPALLLIVWAVFARRVRKPLLAGAGLYLASFAGFSSNFTFVYREIHQAIQLLLIALIIFPAICRGRFPRLNWIFFVLLIFIAISLLNAPFDDDARAQVINYLVVVAVANCLLLALRTHDDIQNLLGFIAVLALVLAGVGLVEFVAGPTLRIETTFSNPNYFGFFLGVGFCAAAAVYRGWPRILALVLIFTALVFTGSRSCLIFPIVALLYDAYRVNRFGQRFFLLAFFTVVVAIVINAGITRFSAREQTLSSDAERYIYALIALRMAKDNPLTGVGWGRFVSEFKYYSTKAELKLAFAGDVDISRQDRRVTHNDYLRILAELGWVAFLLVLMFVVRGTWFIWKSPACRAVGIFPLWAGVMAFSAAHNNMNNALFWFIILVPFVLDKVTTVFSPDHPGWRTAP